MMTAYELAVLRAWLHVEMDKARATARVESRRLADLRTREGLKAAVRASHEHCSAMARLCALGEVLERLDNSPKIS
jgi:hypothetical protein